MSQPHPEMRIDHNALVALLDLIERPAAVVSTGGVIVGSNAAFLRLAETLGDPTPSNLRAVLSIDGLARVEQRLASARLPAETYPLTCVDGIRRAVRLETVGSVDAPGSIAAVMLIIETPAAVDAWLAPTRGEALLRHDLAGPLTAILGTAEMILMRDRDLPREMREGLGQILENCARISRILSAPPAGDASQAPPGSLDEF